MNPSSNVFAAKTNSGVKPAVEMILNEIDQDSPILKSSKDVYIKVNGVHCKEHCYTSPEVLKATIEYFYNHDAKRVFVMEDSTIGNVTRLVFALNGYLRVCKETRAEPIYLDEDKAQTVRLNNEISVDVPLTVARIVQDRDSVTYVNLPKLKTHNATVITLGIKNQFGFLSHKDRKKYHDNRIHPVLVDLYGYIRPDITLIDATEAVSGEMPLIAFESELVRRLDLIVGGRDTLAVDVVGAKLLGYEIEQVPHLQLAYERSFGEGNLSRIRLIGPSLEFGSQQTQWDIVDRFPNDVKVIRGTKKLCREGCEINSLIAVQMMVYDYHGKGGFFVIMGQGFEQGLASHLKTLGFRKGLIVGSCAIDEVGSGLMQAFGKSNIYLSHDCCNVAETVSSMVKLTGLSTFDLLPASMLKSLYLFISAKMHGSRAILAKLF